ncbi:hypothetical protein Cgig2_017365 [Carnegiea gigantea]|uniref:DUF1232 domain-containing protein n=1 Tax=Carnegiea gigantea TaxID=171969 RepID=A0A9Q1K509_9CARY|nr:hypothetical protein Cgig2_017365 [Carnegiea gigantea]
MERDGPPANDCCSICHGNFNIPCQANCSHWFCGFFLSFPSSFVALVVHLLFIGCAPISCFPINMAVNCYARFVGFGQCILRLWDYGSALQPCRCPLCRGPINLLIPTEASLQQRTNPEVANIISRLESYNRLYGERSSSLIQRLRDLPFLLRRLMRDMLDPQRSLPLVIKARVYLAVLLSAIYLLSPVDIIPEGILGIIGLLDDAIILLICFLHVAAIYRSVLVYRHGGS